MQAFRIGHQSKNKTIQKRITKSQRQAQKLYLAGKKTPRRKKKPTECGVVRERQPYPCSPKQMALGDPPAKLSQQP